MNLSDSCCIKVFFRTVLPNFSVEVDRVNSLPPENVPYGVTYFVKCKLCARGIYVLCYYSVSPYYVWCTPGGGSKMLTNSSTLVF